MLDEVIQEVENFSKFISHLEMYDFPSDYWMETFSEGDWGKVTKRESSI